MNNGSLSITACMIKSILQSSLTKDVAYHHDACFIGIFHFHRTEATWRIIFLRIIIALFLGDQLSENLNS